MRIRNVFGFLVIGLLLSPLSFAAAVAAQTGSSGSVQETDDKLKVDLYTKFVETYKVDESAAYQNARRGVCGGKASDG